MNVRQRSKHDLAVALRVHCRKAARQEKGKLLDEFAAPAANHSCHRQHWKRSTVLGVPEVRFPCALQ